MSDLCVPVNFDPELMSDASQVEFEVEGILSQIKSELVGPEAEGFDVTELASTSLCHSKI